MYLSNQPKISWLIVGISLILSSPAGAWDPIRDLTGRSLKAHVERRTRTLERSIDKFMSDPVGYTAKLPIRIIADTCSAPVQYYENALRGQASGRWRTLPPKLIYAVQSQYDIDLRQIRYSEDIRTSNGQAQAFSNNLYFPRSIDLRNRSDLYWMLHELEHSVQFSGARYGSSSKICEYMMKSVGAGFDHDAIDMERAADAKASYLIDFAYEFMNDRYYGPPLYGESLALEEIMISNVTDQTVFFTLETSGTDKTEHDLPPNSYAIFEGSAGDRWFNIYIYTNDYLVTYGLDGGSRQVINWNTRGILDVFPSRF